MPDQAGDARRWPGLEREDRHCASELGLIDAGRKSPVSLYSFQASVTTGNVKALEALINTTGDVHFGVAFFDAGDNYLGSLRSIPP